MAARKTVKKRPKEVPSGPTPEQIEAAKKQRKAQVDQMMALAKIYEETLEPIRAVIPGKYEM